MLPSESRISAVSWIIASRLFVTRASHLPDVLGIDLECQINGGRLVHRCYFHDKR